MSRKHTLDELENRETLENAEPSSPILAAKKVSSGYGDALIVKESSVHVNEGEIVSIIGPNGAGKSTLLKAIFGTNKVYSGSVFLGDTDITNFKPSQTVKEGAAFVPQTDNVFTSLSIRENLEMGGFIRQSGKRERIAQILYMFPELKRRPGEKAGHLSGGQRQALALGRALMLDPKVLILDEPTAALAPKVIQEIFDQIELIRQTGVAVLMVEQNAEYALSISNRGYVMVDGEVVLEQDAKEMLDNSSVGEMFLGR